MDDSSDSPPSPLEHPSKRNTGREHTRRNRRAPKEREHSFLGGSTKDLAKLLVFEERESNDLRKKIYTLTEKLLAETQRADDAERKAREAVLHFKNANDARLAAQQEASRANEELRLYKMQFENAQREIRRAQELLDTVEAQRYDAEEAAARARSTARKLKEERIVQLAREEGRRQGLEEGMTRGRSMGFEEGRAAGYERGRATAAREYMPSSTEFRHEAPPPVSVHEVPPAHNFPGAATRSTPTNTRDVSPAGSPLRNTKEPEIRPVSVHNFVSSPLHPPVDYPPDGWIPTIDGDQRIRLPPPHELAPAPPTPTPSPPATATLRMQDNEQPTLMVPPPENNREPHADAEDIGRPRPRRRRSTESQSTTISQFEIVAPPVASSGYDRATVLSAIAEERERSSSLSSPATGLGGSPYVHGSPNFPMPMSTPAPHTQAPSVAGLEASAGGNYYTRPRSQSSDDSAHVPAGPAPTNSPPRSQSRAHTLHRKGSVSPDTGFNITVEPPSRPDSNMSRMTVPQHRDLLSAEDASEMPSANASETAAPPDVQPAQATPAIAPLSSLSLPLPLPDNGQLPLGFVPIGPPQAASVQAHSPARTAHGAYTHPLTPAAIPLPPSAAPSHQHLYRGTPSVAGSAIPGGFPDSSDPVVIPLPPSTAPSHTVLQSGRYSRTALQRIDSESEEEVSSSISTDTLTTPPQRRKKMPGTSYAAAPTPPNVVYPLPPTPMSTTSRGTRAARVPLPPSSVGGSPRSTYTRMSRAPGSVLGSAVGYNAEYAGRTPMASGRPDLTT